MEKHKCTHDNYTWNNQLNEGICTDCMARLYEKPRNIKTASLNPLKDEFTEIVLTKKYDEANNFWKNGVNPSAYKIGAEAAFNWAEEKIDLQNQKIKAYEDLLDRCEKSFGCIANIHRTLKNADPADLDLLVQAIDLDLPLFQAIVKDALPKKVKSDFYDKEKEHRNGC